MLSFSRLYRPADQSVVQTSFSSLTLVFKLQLSLCFQLVQLYLCAMCVGFALLKDDYISVSVYFGEPTSTLFLPTSSRLTLKLTLKLTLENDFRLHARLPTRHQALSNQLRSRLILPSDLAVPPGPGEIGRAHV